jgi:two-component system, LytTR family, sensor kinase
MEDIIRLNLRRCVAYFLVWTLLGLFFFTQGLTQKILWDHPTPVWQYLVFWLSVMYVWAFLTPVVLRVGSRFPIEGSEGGNRLLRIAFHLLLGTGISIFHVACVSFILSQAGVFSYMYKGFFGAFFVLMTLLFHWGLFIYFALLSIQYGIRYYRRYQERERQALRLEIQASELKTQLTSAQLSALKMQLQPHFLFNTLNAIMVLVRQQNGARAEEMLAHLSDLLRCVLEDVEAQEVPLHRELEYLQLYLSIERMRFEDRLRVEISAEPTTLNAALPQLGLQPIVENAIRHGIGRSSTSGLIRIDASRVDDRLKLRVQDDGPGFRLSPLISTASDSERALFEGIGLANTRARLHQLYGSEASLMIENSQQGGAVVTMTLPYRIVSGTTEMGSDGSSCR